MKDQMAQEILFKAQSRMAEAYFGQDADIEAMPSGLLALLMQLFTSLMAGCGPVAALAFAKRRPKIAFMQAFWHVSFASQNGQEIDAKKFATAVIQTANKSTEEEALAFAKAVPNELEVAALLA